MRVKMTDEDDENSAILKNYKQAKKKATITIAIETSWDLFQSLSKKE